MRTNIITAITISLLLVVFTLRIYGQSPIELKTVVITAKKPIIRQETDRIIYDLEADPESKGSSVFEMMRKVPLLSVDGNERILLRGNAQYRILIDGKPSGMMDRNALDILKSMPASTIKSIEVITSPSAKYDAEGLGLINIVTNKRKVDGYNGSANTSWRMPVGGPGAGTSFTFKAGKLVVSASGGISRSLAPETDGNLGRVTNTSNLSQQYYRRSDGRNNYFVTELSYEVDTLNLLSASFNYNGNSFTRYSGRSSMLMGGSDEVQRYDINSAIDGSGFGTDIGLNYQLGFKADKARLLTFSYRHFNYGSSQADSSAFMNTINYTDPDFRQQNDGRSSEHTLQIDYVRPFKILTLETGIKGIRRENKSDFQHLKRDGVTGEYQTDPARTNRFTNKQNILGAYASAGSNIGKINIKAGIRIEKTIISADFISTASAVSQNYLSGIPSVNINTKLKNNQTLALSYTMRIQRPGIFQLNPFVDRTDPNLESSGNPELRPSLMNDINFSYSSFNKLSLNITLGYSRFNRLITRQYMLNTSTGVLRSAPANVGSAAVLGSNLYMSYSFTPKLSFSLNGNLMYGSLSNINNGVTVKNSGLVYNGNASGNYRFGNGLRLNAGLNLTGPSLDIQETNAAFISSSFGLNKDLIKEKLSFSASVNNAFSKFRTNHMRTFGPGFNQSNDSRVYFRSVNLGLNYRFGQLKDGIKRSKRGIRNDDVSTSQ